MIKTLDKILRKHYLQCLMTVLFTGILLYFTSALWLSKVVIVSFNVEAENDIEYRIFYTEEKGKAFNGQQSVKEKVKSGNQTVDIVLPITNIVRLRMDMANALGKMNIDNLRVRGSHTEELDYSALKPINIDKYEVKDGKIFIVSKQKSPYLRYLNEFNLSGMPRIDWCRLIIISVLSFLLMYKFVQYLSKFKIEKQHSRIDIVMLAVFFALLFVPMSHISNAEQSEQENRMLAKKPQLMIDNKGGGQLWSAI